MVSSRTGPIGQSVSALPASPRASQEALIGLEPEPCRVLQRDLAQGARHCPAESAGAPPTRAPGDQRMARSTMPARPSSPRRWNTTRTPCSPCSTRIHGGAVQHARAELRRDRRRGADPRRPPRRPPRGAPSRARCPGDAQDVERARRLNPSIAEHEHVVDHGDEAGRGALPAEELRGRLAWSKPSSAFGIGPVES